MHSNYLDKNMMYLADAEIDETAFNSFFGSSVLEYAKFYTNTYVQAFERPDALGSILWGAAVKRTPVSLRKWTQYIAVAQELIEKDTTMRGLAADQVRQRTKHFYRTMSPEAFLEVRAPHWRPAASHAAFSHLGPGSHRSTASSGRSCTSGSTAARSARTSSSPTSSARRPRGARRRARCWGRGLFEGGGRAFGAKLPPRTGRRGDDVFSNTGGRDLEDIDSWTFYFCLCALFRV